jgi:hypothetical protein
MDRLTPDCDMFSALVAPAKLPHCTIAAKTLIPFKSPQSNTTSDLQVNNIREGSR